MGSNGYWDRSHTWHNWEIKTRPIASHRKQKSLLRRKARQRTGRRLARQWSVLGTSL